MTKTFSGGEFIRILIQDHNHALSITPLIPCRGRLYLHACLEFMTEVLHTKPIKLSIVKYEHHINEKTIRIVAVFKAVVPIVIEGGDTSIERYGGVGGGVSVDVLSEQGARIPSGGVGK